MARSKGSKKRPLANEDHPRRPKLAQNLRAAPGSFDPRKSSVKALKDWGEGDWDSEEDEFEKGQDKILLEGTRDDGDDFEAPNETLKVHDYRKAQEDSDDHQIEGVAEAGHAPKKQRKIKVIDTLPRGRFAKPLPSDDRPSEEDSEHDEEEEEGGPVDLDTALDHLPPSSSSSISGSEDDDDSEAWRSYHVSTRKSRRGENEVQDAEAAELELADAQRLRQKARAKLVEKDFLAYGGDVPLPRLSESPEEDATVDWTLSKGKEKDKGMAFDSEESAIAYLLKRKPEALALVDDFVRCLKSLRKIEAENALKGIQEPDEKETAELEKWLEEKGKSQMSLAVGWLHYHSLTTYLATLSFYFRLLLSPSSSISLLEKVTLQLAALRQGLSTLEDLGLTSQPSESDSDDEFQRSTMTLLNGAELDEELADLLAESEGSEGEGEGEGESGESDEDEESTSSLVGAKVATKAQATGPAARNPKLNKLEETGSGTKVNGRRNRERRKRERERKRDAAEGGVEDPNSLLALLPPRPSASQASEEFGDDYLEPTALAHHEAAEKAGKKKSLRFYTSKITAKEKRREAATGGGKGKGLSGDEDLTYKTREERRREVLKRQKHGGPDNEDDKPSLDGKRKKSEIGEQDTDEAGGYCDVIKELKEASRAAKKIKYDEQRLADRDTLNAEAESTGPRTAGRQILANRGLTPKRAKANRNPRVKKRLRFESAKKKVASQRAIFKSPEAQMGRSGAYAGEKSGIRDQVVKSRKL